MFIAGSRFVSRWFDLQRSGNAIDIYAEGSALDRAVFASLIVWGVIVLSRRNIDWGRVLSTNALIAGYFLYCLLSITWTDEPGILAKRWIKDLGNPIVALVLLTERRPYDAIVVTLRRLAFAWLPLSVLFIKYYPELGRAYTGEGGAMYAGIADQKNKLGVSCLLVGICTAWRLLLKRDAVDREDIAVGAMLVWLLYMSNSKTALVCLVIALAILVYAARVATAKRLIAVTTAALTVYAVGSAVFDVDGYILRLLSRDPTLTNRTQIWNTLLGLGTNPLIGTGFMSFWTGNRMTTAWAALGAPLNQAHSGYVEQYLNLGYIGVAFIAAIALNTVIRVWRQLDADYSAAVLKLCLVVVALLYNYTEAAFYGPNNMWVLFLAAAIDPPRLQPEAVKVADLSRARLAWRGRLKAGPQRVTVPAGAGVHRARALRRGVASPENPA